MLPRQRMQRHCRRKEGIGKSRRIKVLERGDDKVCDMVTNKYPLKETDCKRPGCLVCSSYWSQPESTPPEYRSRLGTCLTKGACYSITCVTCLLEHRKTRYIGETSRTIYERMCEHVKGLRKSYQHLTQKEIENGGPLLRHHLQYHQGKQSNY